MTIFVCFVEAGKNLNFKNSSTVSSASFNLLKQTINLFSGINMNLTNQSMRCKSSTMLHDHTLGHSILPNIFFVTSTFISMHILDLFFNTGT